MVNILRSYHRYGATVLVGESGCGKRTALRFCAHYMGLDFVEVEAETKETAENFRKRGGGVMMKRTASTLIIWVPS